RAALLREARALAALVHPNVVAIYDVGVSGEDDEAWIAMEYVAGRTLGAWLHAGPPWAEVVRAFVAAARGLAAAHAAGLVHGDFKPGNVLRADDGRVVVIDFGLSRWLEVAPSAPQGELESVRGGTEGYVAPEKAAGALDSAASDQYAWGVALRQGLEAAASRAPRQAWSIAARATSVDPASRWPSMIAAADALLLTSRPRRLWPVGVLAVAVATLGPLAITRAEAPADACADAAADVESLWNDDRRAAMAARFDAVDRPFAAESFGRVVTIVDERATQLGAAWTAACEAAAIHGPDAARTECLEGRTRALGEFVAQHSRALTPERAAGAVGAAHGLPDVRPCESPAYLAAEIERPADPVLRARVKEIERALDKLRGSMDRAPGDAVAGARELLAEAAALGDEPIRARAMNDLSVMLHLSGAFEEARPLMESAFFAARAAKLDVLALKIASNLVGLHESRGEYDEAMVWERHGATLVDDAPDPIVASKLHFNVSVVLQEQGRLPEARARLEQALEIREQILGPEHPTTMNARVELANIRVLEGDVAGGRADLERALAAYERAFGPDHPDVALVLNNLGNLDGSAGELEAARGRFARAIEIRERAYGVDHPSLGNSLANLAKIDRQLGEVERALGAARRALAIREATLGGAHASVVAARELVAELEAEVGAEEATAP
ncbi:MAG: tetratricopeptide repeat protein, partial [Myxococcales bacterium]|nr:tetratricopeptide repeat protein [Myxococcales bacterium]